ncbi:MAG: ABC transporter ATP-binding protein/permease [Oscillospiraceae bacterium]|nr:ABC transporter ATP-binding protein/permease [Oscillospiraceae bacterium]
MSEPVLLDKIASVPLRNKLKLLLMLLRNIRLLAAPLAGVVICAVGGSYALMTTPRLIGELIDRLGTGSDFLSELLPRLAVIAALFIAAAFLNWLTAIFANMAANRTAKMFRTALFQKLQRLPLSYLDTRSRGDVMNRFSGCIDAVSDGLNQGLVQLVNGLSTVILALIFMLQMKPAVTLVAVLTTPLCFGVGFVITRYGARRFREQAAAQGALSGYTEEMITGQVTVAAFNREKAVQKQFGQLNEALYQAGYRAQFASALVNPSTRLVTNLTYVLVGVGAVLYGLSAGTVSSFLSYTAGFSRPFNDISAVSMQLQQAFASAERIFDLLDRPDQPADGENAAVLALPEGEVVFDRVTFSYRPDQPVIRNFSLSVKPGQTVAIVGRTGAGKTTLVNLLMRFYEIQDGNIRIDGQDIRLLTRESLSRSFGMVLQDSWLFAGTIAENIAYGKPDAAPEEIEKAARAAHAHGFIRRLPKGYKTMIDGESGNLSAGQRQQLTIARAMLADPPILILDEATSSVDILTEARIQRAFRQMTAGKTAFIIAHRLSTVRNADTIVVLDRGNIVETGNHRQLLEKDGFYAQLYRSYTNIKG